MENTNITFKYFDQSLVQRVIDFTELTADKKTKESIKVFSEEIKVIYLEKDRELKQNINDQLIALKREHLANLEELDKNLERDIAEANSKNLDSKELHNVKFGLETACKREKIKEKNRYNEEINEL